MTSTEPECGWLQEPGTDRAGCVQPTGHFGAHQPSTSATSTEHDEQCEAEFVAGAGAWTLCDCLLRRTPDTEQAVMFAPDGWDEKTQSPVDEQAESLRDADPPPEPDTVIAECECWVTPEWQWTKHYGAVEPGSQWEPNPECPVHFPSRQPVAEAGGRQMFAFCKGNPMSLGHIRRVGPEGLKFNGGLDGPKVTLCGVQLWSSDERTELTAVVVAWLAKPSRFDGRISLCRTCADLFAQVDDDLPDWYGNFCMSCNHPHPEGD